MFLLHALMPILLDRGESRVETPIVSDRRLGEPRTNRELFDLPQRDAWIEDLDSSSPAQPLQIGRDLPCACTLDCP
jgi:hypothetical protein